MRRLLRPLLTGFAALHLALLALTGCGDVQQDKELATTTLQTTVPACEGECEMCAKPQYTYLSGLPGGIEVIRGTNEDGEWLDSARRNQFAAWRVALGFLSASCDLTQKQIDTICKFCKTKTTFAAKLDCMVGELFDVKGTMVCKDMVVCFEKLAKCVLPGVSVSRKGGKPKSKPKKSHAWAEVKDPANGDVYAVDPLNGIINKY